MNKFEQKIKEMINSGTIRTEYKAIRDFLRKYGVQSSINIITNASPSENDTSKSCSVAVCIHKGDINFADQCVFRTASREWLKIKDYQILWEELAIYESMVFCKKGNAPFWKFSGEALEFLNEYAELIDTFFDAASKHSDYEYGFTQQISIGSPDNPYVLIKD